MHSLKGFIIRVTFWGDDVDTIEEIDVVVEEDPMKNEFLYMQEIMDTKNREQMNVWLDKSTMTVTVLEQALQSISKG